MNNLIYLDYAATTPVAPEVAKLMAEYLTLGGCFANPASRSHMAGWQAEQAVEKARQQVAYLIGSDVREIVWTSGATEANNLAIIGAARANPDKGRHIITSAIEHKAVLDTCHWLEKDGYTITRLQPNAQGQITVEQVAAALTPDTFMVSLMLVNNELGTVNPVTEIGELLKNHSALFHVDAAQAAGKLPIDVNQLKVDLLSLSGHKFYGPKGVGALYVRRQPAVHLEAIIHGGGHERGMRSGTLPTHQLVGIGLAAAMAAAQIADDKQHVSQCCAAFLQQLNPNLYVQTAANLTNWPGIVNLAFPNVEAETLMMALPDLAVSTGSACNAASIDPSYVLVALGLNRATALSSIRFSFGRYLTLAQANFAGQQVNQALERLKN
ncbi:MAG TPA: aminotransferase class V-fold PLP-dependent enzyme [Marinospirillum sp.]|uniref:aminotransferase class V-fold PLP-dependent enzyme n=1 Tax=Marinospirillum sp. TaxID=2183934 RepID=UPI002B461CCE|nr:aminotransferase class V-fold PLP-dependent enzyme [Marinospirillum sp.]HKM16258.1 aminotransferase class V-fold PLP-dependent enzyme [Marinospirillum sp.]